MVLVIDAKKKIIIMIQNCNKTIIASTRLKEVKYQ